MRKSVSGETVEESMEAMDRNMGRCWKAMARNGRICPRGRTSLGFDKTAKLRSAESDGLVTESSAAR